MKEYKVGEQIVLVVEEASNDDCLGCVFTVKNGGCCEPQVYGSCCARNRSDGKNVIFVEKKGK